VDVVLLDVHLPDSKDLTLLSDTKRERAMGEFWIPVRCHEDHRAA